MLNRNDRKALRRNRSAVSWLCVLLLFLVVYVSLEGAFLVANLQKFWHGGYVSLFIAGVIILLMWVWFRATRIKKKLTEYEKLADYITKNVSMVNDVQGQNLRDFMEHLPAELRVAAWSKFTAHGIEKLELTKSIHKWCVTSILEALSVPKEDVEKVQATTAGKTTKKAKAK